MCAAGSANGSPCHACRSLRPSRRTSAGASTSDAQPRALGGSAFILRCGVLRFGALSRSSPRPRALSAANSRVTTSHQPHASQPRPHAGRPWQPDGDPGRRRYTPALSSTQGVVLPHTFLARRCAATAKRRHRISGRCAERRGTFARLLEQASHLQWQRSPPPRATLARVGRDHLALPSAPILPRETSRAPAVLRQ